MLRRNLTAALSECDSKASAILLFLHRPVEIAKSTTLFEHINAPRHPSHLVPNGVWITGHDTVHLGRQVFTPTLQLMCSAPTAAQVASTKDNLRMAVGREEVNVLQELLKVTCLETIVRHRRNLTNEEYTMIFRGADTRINTDFIQRITTMNHFTLEKAGINLEVASIELKDAEAELAQVRGMLEAAEYRFNRYEGMDSLKDRLNDLLKVTRELDTSEERQKRQQRRSLREERSEKMKPVIDAAIHSAKWEIQRLPARVEQLSSALKVKGIYTLKQVFGSKAVAEKVAEECGFTKITIMNVLFNPYLKLLDYPVSSFATRRVMPHVQTTQFISWCTQQTLAPTLRMWSSGSPPEIAGLEDFFEMLHILSKRLLDWEKQDVYGALMDATAMRPTPMTGDSPLTLGLDLIGTGKRVVADQESSYSEAKEHRPIRCVVSAPHSGKSRTLDDVARHQSLRNPPMHPSSEPGGSSTLIVHRLVVNISYSSHTPLRAIESDMDGFYQHFWGRFLRGCCHPLLPDLFSSLLKEGYSTDCRYTDILRIIEDVYGIGYNDLTRLVVNVDEFGRVLDKHKLYSDCAGNEEEYSSFMTLLAQGVKFTFSGTHSHSMSCFDVRRPVQYYELPTLSLGELKGRRTATCILNAVATLNENAFPLADYEAAKTSMGLLGRAVERCLQANGTPPSELFTTPWGTALKRNHQKHLPALYSFLKTTLREESIHLRENERSGLCIREQHKVLSIHPYALYSLLNVAPASDLMFEAAVLEMWHQFKEAVRMYHEAIVNAATINRTVDAAAVISASKGPVLETLTRHILHLRALAHGKNSEMRAVARFPTLVDSGSSDDANDNSVENGSDEIRELVSSVQVGFHVVVNPSANHNVAAVLQRSSDMLLRIDIYAIKHFDDKIPQNEHRNKYFASLVGILHLRRTGLLPGNICIQFHFVAVLPVFDEKTSPLSSKQKAEVCPVAPAYIQFLNHPADVVTIIAAEDLLRDDGVIVEKPCVYDTQDTLEKLLTKPLLLLLPTG